jgi:7-cyano-7-deazaguanine synthase
VNALDYSGYPDCQPEFIRAFAGVESNLAGGARFPSTPAEMTKADIIRQALELGVDLSLARLLRSNGRW